MCVRYLTPDKMEEVQQIIDTLGTVSIRIPENELVARANPEVGPGVTAPIIVIGRKFDGKDAADRAKCCLNQSHGMISFRVIEFSFQTELYRLSS